MAATSIPISGLNNFSVIETGDFVALVESSSLTTYRTSIQGLFDFMAITASCLSASYSNTSSYSHRATSASYADSSSVAISASHADMADNSTSASYSISSSYSVSSSISFDSMNSRTASLALNVPNAQTASFLLYQGFFNGSASFAISSSWAQQSGTASYALSIPTSGPVSVAGTVPIGTIVDYAGTSISDTNWMICDGSAINRTTYATLFTAIGTTWGNGDGVNTFNIPDLRKRLTLGARGSLTDNIFSNASPSVGGSMLSGSVGNTGGGEAYQYHYHIISQHYTKPNNDDYFVCYIGYNKSLSTYHMYPARQTSVSYPPPANRMFPVYYITGDSSGRTQPASYDGAWTTNSSPLLASSFAVSDTNTWFTCPAYPNDWQKSKWFLSSGTATANYNRNDLSMPYAVTNKIIRVL